MGALERIDRSTWWRRVVWWWSHVVCHFFGHREAWLVEIDLLRQSVLSHIEDHAGQRWGCRRCAETWDNLSDEAREYFNNKLRTEGWPDPPEDRKIQVALLFPEKGGGNNDEIQDQRALREWRFWRMRKALGNDVKSAAGVRHLCKTHDTSAIGLRCNGEFDGCAWVSDKERNEKWGDAIKLACAQILGEDPRKHPWNVKV